MRLYDVKKKTLENPKKVWPTKKHWDDEREMVSTVESRATELGVVRCDTKLF